VKTARASGNTARDDLYAGVSLSGVRDLAATGWAAGIIIACVLMIPAPPTAQLGGWGWAAAIGVQALSLSGLIAFRRRGRGVTFRTLLVVTWLLPIDLGVMQWLAGGCARAWDQIFRWGGDEFAVLLPDTDPVVAEAIFARLEATVAELVRDPAGAPITITFGWSAGDEHTQLSELTAQADTALLGRKRRASATTPSARDGRRPLPI
jgi:hypothetical protein